LPRRSASTLRAVGEAIWLALAGGVELCGGSQDDLVASAVAFVRRDEPDRAVTVLGAYRTAIRRGRRKRDARRAELLAEPDLVAVYSQVLSPSHEAIAEEHVRFAVLFDQRGEAIDRSAASLRASFATASEQAIHGEDLEALELCFELLPEEYRGVIVASKLLGQSHEEIAAELGKNEGAVRMLLHRALARLSRLMCDRRS